MNITSIAEKIDSMEDVNIDGAEVLNDVRDFIGRFCAFPDQHCLTAVALWAAHAHMVGHFYTTPRLAIVSPEKGSGKTRVLEVLNLLVPDPMMSISASSAPLFRTLAQQQITLLFDEVDTGLDTSTALAMYGMLEKRLEGRILVVVSHNDTIIQRYRSYKLSDGRVEQ